MVLLILFPLGVFVGIVLFWGLEKGSAERIRSKRYGVYQEMDWLWNFTGEKSLELGQHIAKETIQDYGHSRDAIETIIRTNKNTRRQLVAEEAVLTAFLEATDPNIRDYIATQDYTLQRDNLSGSTRW